MERIGGMYGGNMKLLWPTMKFKNLTKCWDIAEVMKYGGSVGMVERYHNIPQSIVDYEKSTKYGESVGQRGRGHKQMNQECFRPTVECLEKFLSMGVK
jgi:hypothetical protein